MMSDAAEKSGQEKRGQSLCSKGLSPFSCPIRQCLWPRSTAGRIIVIVIVLAAIGVVLAVMPGKSDAQNRLARYDALMRAGSKEEAAKVLGGVIEAAIETYNARRFDEAKVLFEEVLKRAPEKPIALNYLGLLEGALGDKDKAVACFKKAAEVDPLSPEHPWNLAMVYYDRKEYEACEESLRTAMRLGLKAQYRLLYAFCAVERKLPTDVVIQRLRETVNVAEAQANLLKEEDLRPDGSLFKVFREAVKRLTENGDRFGHERLQELATSSPKRHVREFAKVLLGSLPDASGRNPQNNRLQLPMDRDVGLKPSGR